MAVQDTSIDAYQDNASNFERMTDRIMAYMLSHRETRTRAEIAEKLGIATATMSGRIHELIRKGRLVVEPRKLRCRVTRNMVQGVSAA